MEYSKSFIDFKSSLSASLSFSTMDNLYSSMADFVWLFAYTPTPIRMTEMYGAIAFITFFIATPPRDHPKTAESAKVPHGLRVCLCHS